MAVFISIIRAKVSAGCSNHKILARDKIFAQTPQASYNYSDERSVWRVGGSRRDILTRLCVKILIVTTCYSVDLQHANDKRKP